jgi:hypothetical protein
MRDRTADLLRARQALSQLSYSPKLGVVRNHKTCQVNQIVSDRGAIARTVLIIRERCRNEEQGLFGRPGQI